MYRQHTNPDISFPLMNSMSLLPPKHYWPGPLGVLLQRLHDVAWHWEGDGVLIDHDAFRWHVFDTPIQVLELRLRQGWQIRAGAIAAQRPSFSGLHAVDPHATLEGWHKRAPADQGILRQCLNGSFFTQDRLFKARLVDSDLCPWCPAQDSQHHRHWECTHFQRFRDPLTSAFWTQWDRAPPCTTDHGWLLEVPGLAPSRNALATLPTATRALLRPPEASTLHFFTDGGALLPQEPRGRLGAWALVAADLDHDSFRPIGWGLLDGMLQTVLRAEATAAIAALEAGLRAHADFCIWTDNQLVYTRLETAREGQGPPGRMSPDHDLWTTLFSLVHRAGPSFVRAVKVTSHLAIDRLPTEVERWAARGNQAADAQVTEVLSHLPSPLGELHAQLAQELRDQREFGKALHDVFLHIGREAVRSPHRHAKPAAPVDPGVDDCPLALPLLRSSATMLPRRFAGDDDHTVLHWLRSLEEEGATPRWLAWHQLYVDFQLTEHQLGPWRPKPRGRAWKSGTEWKNAEEDFQFQRFSQWFSAFVLQLGRAVGDTWQLQHRRPDSHCYVAWSGCIKLPITQRRWERLEHALLSQLGGVIRHLRRDLADLRPFF